MIQATPQITSDATDAGYRYWAFISYSHHDIALVKRLHSSIETWPVPRNLIGRETPVGKLPRRLFPIFRDRDEISGGESLDDVIRAALKTSRYLIVICSPQSARSMYVNEEIRTFKAMGRSARVIYLIADTADSNKAITTDCFAPMALCAVSPDGTAGTERVEPVAADARRGKDGRRNALLKVLARLLNVGFDELNRRELRRLRRAKAMAGTLATLLLLVIFVGYLSLADAGVKLPAGDFVRTELDRHQRSFFRPAPSSASIRLAAQSYMKTLSAALAKKRQPDGWFNDPPPGDPPGVGVWSHSQCVVALLRNPAAEGPSLAKLMESADLLFRPGTPVEVDGIKWGWRDAGAAIETTTYSYMALWLSMGLCEELEQPSVRADAAARSRVMQQLVYTQQVLSLYHHDTDPGAWDAAGLLSDPQQHSVYASTMAVLALLEAHRADVPWDGSTQRRDELLKQAAQWLIGQYNSTGQQHGWVNNLHEEHASEIFDGLTLQTYCALMEAEDANIGITVPQNMRQDIRQYLLQCGQRRDDYAIDAGETRLPYRHANGEVKTDQLTIRYLWWPWGVRCADSWLRYADKNNLPMEQRVEVRRAFAHLVVTLGPQEVAKVIEGYAYVMAEDLWCLRKLEEK